MLATSKANAVNALTGSKQGPNIATSCSYLVLEI
jgi:hypothetical protein